MDSLVQLGIALRQEFLVSNDGPGVGPLADGPLFVPGGNLKVHHPAVSENGRMVVFQVSAWDEKGPIGKGSHTRAIIGNEKFLAKCNSKLDK